MIRRLTPEDADAFFRLRLFGLELHPEAFGTGAEAWREATPAQTHAALEPVEDPTERFVLGAFAVDELVGLVGFRREARPSLRHKGSLWGFFVHPEHRRRGLGGELLATAMDEVRTCIGLGHLRLVATTANEDALRLFAAHGFIRYGLEDGGLRVGGVAFDQAFLRCDLG